MDVAESRARSHVCAIMPTGGASNPSYETRQGEALHLKILPAPLGFWTAFRPWLLSWTLMALLFTSMS